MGTNGICRKLHLAFVLAIVTLIATPKSTSAFLWLSPDQWRHVRPINEVSQSSEFNSNGWVLFGITSIHYIDVIFLATGRKKSKPGLFGSEGSRS